MNPMHSEPADRRPMNFLAVLAALVSLTALAMAASFIVHDWLRLALIATAALCKASVVVGWFMQLRFEGRLLYYIAILPCVLTIILIAGSTPDIVWNRPTPASVNAHD